MVAERAVIHYPLAHVNYGDEEIDAVITTLRSGRTTAGKRVASFEQRFAEYVGRKYAVMVNSGSSADLLVAHGIHRILEPGDEILVPAVTWPTQIWSCVMAGYTVRLVDVDPATLQMDIADLEQNLNGRTRGVFLVHVLGNVGDMNAISQLLGLQTTVIEDCCEAMGARWRGQHVGTFGKAAAFSFFFSHLLNTMEGGMVVTDDETEAHDYRLWRSHGWEPKVDYPFWFPTWGLNVRPTELQGAFGNVQMARLDMFKAARTRNYARLANATYEAWSDYLHGVTVLPECEPSWHGFPLMVAPEAPFNKIEFCRHLDAHGIETRPIVAGNFARQPVAQGHPKIISGDLPGADKIHTDGLYIGIASFDDEAGTDYVGEVVDDFLRVYR